MFNRIVKVDHSPRHYYAAQQVRAHPTTSRYESGYDYDYSGGGYNNSFSTTEAHPVQQSYMPAAASAYPSSYQSQVASAMYPGTSNVQQQPQYYSQAAPVTNPYGYGYGYAAHPQTSRQQQSYDPRAQQYNQRQF